MRQCKMYTPVKYIPRKTPYKFVTLSFDDGVKQDIKFIELLKKYGIRATFNLNSGLFGTVHDLVTPEFTVDHSEIARCDIANVYSEHEIASHSLTHPRLDLLSREELIHEIRDDRDALEEISGQKVFGMAYPGGPFYNDFVIETILSETPIRYARTTDSTKDFTMPVNLMEWNPTCHWHDDAAGEIIDKYIALEPKEDSVLYIWGHSYEFDAFDAWNDVEELLSRISGHSDMTYATNGEIAEYIINKTEKK